ncbi:MAG: TIGR02281 family clan AA aspartic protease [Salinisphaera sp.]|jgi:aspartyl protease family protein|nr:TIGR02281 family clan AA aspartic protease [Salinisphaera sp.]
MAFNHPDEDRGLSGVDSMRALAPIAIAFVLIICVFWFAFHRIIENRQHPNRSLVASGPRDNLGSARVVLSKSLDGQFRTPGTINGQLVRFMVDTGASDVAVSPQVAQRIGLRRGPRITVETATGAHTAYQTHIDRVVVGSIALSNVRGAIVPGMSDSSSLLGMSFLKYVNINVSRDKMVLH